MSSETISERVVVIAPTRRDGEITQRLLSAWGIEAAIIRRFDEIDAAMKAGMGALILTDIALAEPEAAAFLDAMRAQPSWSNLPVVMVCRDGFQSPPITMVIKTLRNVTVLDRPCSTRAMVSAVQAALRGRRWQYQIRDQLKELQRVEAAMRKASERKDEFIATLAHELRNPLAPIRTGLQALGTDALPRDKSVALLAMMERQLGRLMQLIDDLLDVARISTGKVALKRRRVDLRDIVRTAVESCEPALQVSGHVMTLDIPSQPLVIEGDAVRLAQVVSNLVGNAIKYTANGGRIHVALQPSDTGATIAVQDNGIGIPASMQGRIFDMFTQVGPGAADTQDGLGIGLSLAKRLVEMHGGTVRMESTVGQGSTFFIHLPGVTVVERIDTEVAATASSMEATASRPLKALIVDDNRDAADSLAILLEIDGHTTRVEYNGREAVNAAVDFLPDVVFCDIGMHEMSGIDVATKLRQDGRFAATTLVAVTGWGAEADLHRTRHAGFDFHLTKPVSYDSIAQILSNL